jgi:hypothetical protein
MPLAVGTLTYAAWRSTDVRIVTWMSRIAPRGVRTLHDALAPDGSRATAVILGSLPDAAWAWAFGAALSLVWLGRPWREKLPWLGGGALLALFAEIGQAMGVVPGTFDVVDLVAIALGFAAGAMLAGRRRVSAAETAPRPTRAPSRAPSRSDAR